MITLYGVLLFLHVFGAAIWLGGEVVMLALQAIALRSADASRAVALIRDTDRVNVLIILPASMMLLGSGLWLVVDGDWGFDRFFVLFGLAGFVVSSIVGAAVTSPGGKALRKAVERDGVESREVLSLTRRIQFGLLVDVLLLTTIVFVMATKPTL